MNGPPLHYSTPGLWNRVGRKGEVCTNSHQPPPPLPGCWYWWWWWYVCYIQWQHVPSPSLFFHFLFLCGVFRTSIFIYSFIRSILYFVRSTFNLIFIYLLYTEVFFFHLVWSIYCLFVVIYFFIFYYILLCTTKSIMYFVFFILLFYFNFFVCRRKRRQRKRQRVTTRTRKRTLRRGSGIQTRMSTTSYDLILLFDLRLIVLAWLGLAYLSRQTSSASFDFLSCLTCRDIDACCLYFFLFSLRG